jgi:hypothetical protein
MTKEGKFIIGAFVATILMVVGAVFWFSGRSGAVSKGDSLVGNARIEVIEVSPDSIDLGRVEYGGGIVSKEFEIKNTSAETLKLRKITTSCMCTKAKVQIGDRETKFFSMEMAGDLNPLVDLDLPAGETARVMFQFDPAAHGPQGAGPFDRVVVLYFAEGFIDLGFGGEVII